MVDLYFYSRCPGWDSAAIARHNAAPEALRNLARVYDTWHLYPAGTCVGCGPEHCV